MKIPNDPYAWRECLGPAVDQFQETHIKQYKKLIDYKGRPGKTGQAWYDKYFSQSPSSSP